MPVSNFDVLKKMAADNLDIRIATDMLNAQMTKKGTQVTFGVGGDVIASLMTDKLCCCLLLWDREQFNKVKKELEHDAGRNIPEAT